MNLNLDTDENIELIVKKKKSIPLRKEDFLKIPMLIFASIFIYFFFKNDYFKGKNPFLNLYFIFFGVLTISFIFYVLNNFYKRYLNVFRTEHILTNKRLIIVDHKHKIQEFFYYENFPKVEFEENIFNSNGSIIIGEREPLLAESRSLISYRVGVNFSENDTIIYNVINIKNIYNDLKSKIKSFETNTD